MILNEITNVIMMRLGLPVPPGATLGLAATIRWCCWSIEVERPRSWWFSLPKPDGSRLVTKIEAKRSRCLKSRAQH